MTLLVNKINKNVLKQLLKEELGLFKKDTIAVKNKDKSNQKFELEKSNNNSIKKNDDTKSIRGSAIDPSQAPVIAINFRSPLPSPSFFLIK